MKYKMRKNLFGQIIRRIISPGSLATQPLLSVMTRAEGGQMTSLSLRKFLDVECGVQVGNYSYGSLLTPGMSDRGLTIGAYVSVGPNVRRFGAAHPLDRLSMHPYFYNPVLGLVDGASDVPRTKCIIGDDVWIGANVTILPSCTYVGSGSVIGAGSVLTKDIPDFSLAVGNSARVIRERLSNSDRKRVSRPQFWSRGPQEILEDIEQATITAR